MIRLRYRKTFHLDYWQGFYTPYRVMVEDMQILSLENKIKLSYTVAKNKAKSGTIKK